MTCPLIPDLPPGIEGNKEADLMARRTLMLLAFAAVVCFAGATREAQAACSSCATTCASGCIADGGCLTYSSTQCSGGVSTCYYQCRNGSYGYQDCGCGAGSPIFKKKPVDPGPNPNNKSLKQPTKLIQPVPAAKPAPAAKPEPPAKAEQPAKPEESAPTGSTQND